MTTDRVGEPTAGWQTAPRLLTKSVYEKPAATDGLRVLVTQYWPRGIAKEAIDEYLRVLGPSRSLLHSFKGGEITWDQYRRQYLSEMDGEVQRAAIHRLATIVRNQSVTVMCVCQQEEECHRSLLRGLIEELGES